MQPLPALLLRSQVWQRRSSSGWRRPPWSFSSQPGIPREYWCWRKYFGSDKRMKLSDTVETNPKHLVHWVWEWHCGLPSGSEWEQTSFWNRSLRAPKKGKMTRGSSEPQTRSSLWSAFDFWTIIVLDWSCEWSWIQIIQFLLIPSLLPKNGGSNIFQCTLSKDFV